MAERIKIKIPASWLKLAEASGKVMHTSGFEATAKLLKDPGIQGQLEAAQKLMAVLPEIEIMDAATPIKSDDVPITREQIANIVKQEERKRSRRNIARQALIGAIRPASDNLNKIPAWETRNPSDPEPILPWYTPARFFARSLIKDDPTLLLKRDLLAAKVSKSMFAVGIKKRGGKLPFDPGTVKKAFANVKFG